MPDGKPAGVPCVQLDDALRCRIFGRPERPACCSGLAPSTEMCGADRVHALRWLGEMERETAPVRSAARVGSRHTQGEEDRS